jgi:hypothetical protein
VVEKLDLEKGSRFGKASGKLEIGRAGIRITGRMVMHHQKGVGGMEQCRAENFTGMCNALVEAAHRDFLHPQEMMFGI